MVKLNNEKNLEIRFVEKFVKSYYILNNRNIKILFQIIYFYKKNDVRLHI